MIKNILILFATVLTSTIESAGVPECNGGIDVFDMIPWAQIRNIVVEEYQSNSELLALLVYFNSSVYEEKAKKLEETATFVDLAGLMVEHNIRILYALDQFRSSLQVLKNRASYRTNPHLKEVRNSENTVDSFLLKIKATMKRDELSECFKAVVSESSPILQPDGKLILGLKSVRASNEYKDIIDDLLAHKFDANRFINRIMDLFGIPYLQGSCVL